MNMQQRKEDLIAEGRALQQQVKDLTKQRDEVQEHLTVAIEQREEQRTRANEAEAQAAAPYQRGCPKDHDMPPDGHVYVRSGPGGSFVFCSKGHCDVYSTTVWPA